MVKQAKGFSLIELLVVIIIFGFVIAAVSQMFTSSLTTFKQQGKIVETSIEGIIGMELLRRDLEGAGYGLPWEIPAGLTYAEAAAPAAAVAYNDSPASGSPSTSGIPRPVSGGDGAGYLSGTDYLVVKATSVARNAASRKWNFLPPGGATAITAWPEATENLNATDWVTVLYPGTAGAPNPALVNLGAAFSWQLSNIPLSVSTGSNTFIIYGMDTNTALAALRAPFNRADYYVKSAGVSVPAQCAANTGVLFKATMNQSDGNFTELPLLDCVADMQVTYHLDTNADGVIDSYRNDLAGLDAQTVRTQLRETLVFVLAQEGQQERGGISSQNTRLVGESPLLGRTFNFTTAGITNWQNYRWKLYTLVVKFH